MKLSKPIKKGDEEIFDITLREPTGQDLIEIGYPYVIVMDEADGQSLKLQSKSIARYISRLGAIPPSTVEKISLADLQVLTGEVMSFFGVAAAN